MLLPPLRGSDCVFSRREPGSYGPVEETAASTSSRARRTLSHAPKAPNVSSRRRKPTGRRRQIRVFFLDGRPAPSGPVARRGRLVVRRSRSVGLRLRLLTWCPCGASRAQVFQQVLTAQVTRCRASGPHAVGLALRGRASGPHGGTIRVRLLFSAGCYQQPARGRRAVLRSVRGGLRRSRHAVRG